MTAAHSLRLGQDVHFGKRDARPVESGTPLLADLLKAIPQNTGLPPLPEHFGHGYAFPVKAWGMLGNGPDDTVSPGFKGCGDCYWSGSGHEEMEAAKTAGRPVPAFSGATIVRQYAAYSGYDPTTGENDNGTDLQEGIAWRQTTGLLDDHGNAYRIGQHVALTPGDVHQLWLATWLFECVGLGVRWTEANMAQFDAGQPIDYRPGATVVGGHYVPVMGPTGLITWGERVSYTRAFIQGQVDEAFAYLDPERYNAVTGHTAEGFADMDLERYIVAVARLQPAA